MFKCNNCGQEFEGRFCPNCGADVNQNKTCPNCGSQLAGNAKFCTECGYSFGGTLVKGGDDAPTVQAKPSSLDNLYVLARRALKSKDYEKTETYYSQILLTNPNDWEAMFYSVLANARVFSGKHPEGAFGRLNERLTPVYGLIKKSFPDKRTQCEKLNEVVSELNSFIQDYCVRSGTKENRHIHHGTVYIRNTLWACGDNIVKTFGDGDEFNKIAVELWKQGVNVAKELLDYIRQTNAQNSYYYFAEDKNAEIYVAKIKQYNDKIKQKDPSYTPQQIRSTKSGCYVATCVYGSYDCAEVWTLRRYRDDTLAATRGGRAFIRFYYAISPTIVKLFGKQKWFHKLFKNKLDKKVEKLQKQGVASTPYKDKDWQ